MFQVNNVTEMPFDIQESIFKFIDNGEDFYNYKNTCKTFQNVAEFNPVIKVNLFKFRLIIRFPN